MRVAVVVSLCAALAAPAHAGGDEEERARAHYEIGLGLYRLGDYQAALKEFAAGYELAHKPGFLLNLGQTYRKLGELREARDMYRQFLAEVRADDAARPQAQKVLAEIEDALRAQPPSAAPPPSTAPPPVSAPPPPFAVTPAPPVEPPPVATAAPPPAAPSLRAEAPAHHRQHALRIAGVTVGAIGLACIGVGIGMAVDASATADRINAADASGAAFSSADDRAYATDRGVSAGFLAGGAAFAATGAVLLIVSAR
jgi:tetratricopeptide (TPR) repeat protein